MTFHLQFDLTNRLNSSNLMLKIIEVISPESPNYNRKDVKIFSLLCSVFLIQYVHTSWRSMFNALLNILVHDVKLIVLATESAMQKKLLLCEKSCKSQPILLKCLRITEIARDLEEKVWRRGTSIWLEDCYQIKMFTLLWLAS